MIIDSKHYGGVCSCGRTHTINTPMSIVEAGCLNRLEEYVAESGLSGFRTVVYDRNTYNAKGMVRPKADQEVILNPDNLHANEHGVAMLMEQLTENTDYLIAVGSGTVHDIVRYCAYKKGIPFVSCPTAASVDGYCSSVAAMTWEGAKKTLTAVAPVLVIADLNVITQAPAHLVRSGFGDMIGKYTALTDWRIAHAITGEYYCSRIAQIMEQATQAVLDSAEGIASGNQQAFENLTYGLLLSGIAMQMIGNSRPASAAEHHISHCIEMAPEGLGVHSDALPGEKVGVGTILASAEYHRLAQMESIEVLPYTPIDQSWLREFFGEELYPVAKRENEKECLASVTPQAIAAAWNEIRGIISHIPASGEIEQLLMSLGAKHTLKDIGVEEEKRPLILDTSPLIRNRLTLMRMRRMIRH